MTQSPSATPTPTSRGPASPVVGRAAVLGSPVAHSLSPIMHAAAYERLGLAWEYGRHDVDEAGLAPLVAALDGSWRGLSLTMPLKGAAFDVATRVDDLARQVGAVNTLVRDGDGWAGTNTDVAGIVAALAREGIGRVPRVLVLGSGATTRSALRAVADLDAGHVTFAVRSQVRPETLDLAASLAMTTASVSLTDAAAVADVAADHDLVIDTLPGAAADPVARALAGRDDLPALFEVIYEGWPTALARAFAASGAPVASGLVMLAYQGAEQVRLMTGLQVPDDLGETMLAAALAALDA